MLKASDMDSDHTPDTPADDTPSDAPPPLQPGSVQAMVLHRLWTGVQPGVDYPKLSDYTELIPPVQHLTRNGASWVFSAPNDDIAKVLLATFPDGRYELDHDGNRILRFMSEPGAAPAVACEWTEGYEPSDTAWSHTGDQWNLFIEDRDALGEVPLDIAVAGAP